MTHRWGTFLERCHQLANLLRVALQESYTKECSSCCHLLALHCPAAGRWILGTGQQQREVGHRCKPRRCSWRSFVRISQPCSGIPERAACHPQRRSLPPTLHSPVPSVLHSCPVSNKRRSFSHSRQFIAATRSSVQHRTGIGFQVRVSMSNASTDFRNT